MDELTANELFEVYERVIPLSVFTAQQKKVLIKNFKTINELGFAIQKMKHIPKEISFESKVKFLNYNFKRSSEIYKFLNNNVRLGKDFKFDFDLERNSSHPENINEIKIINKNKQVVVTFNAFFTYPEKNKTTLIINNLQSGYEDIYNSDRRKQKLNNLRKELDKLNEILGENWRVYFTKKIKQFANIKRIPLIMQLPGRFSVLYPESSFSEYIRQVRQYIQTAIKAGIPIKDIDTSIIYKEVKEHFEDNLKNKTRNQEKQKKIFEKKKSREARLKMHIK